MEHCCQSQEPGLGANNTEAVLHSLEEVVPRRRPGGGGPLLEIARKKVSLSEGPKDSLGGLNEIWKSAYSVDRL